MRIIFSRDRPAQLDLLLRSLRRHLPVERTTVIWRATDDRFEQGYAKIRKAHLPENWFREGEESFDEALRLALSYEDKTVTFFCDDDVVIRSPGKLPGRYYTKLALAQNEKLMTVSLRLGQGNLQMPVPQGFPVWNWVDLPRHDFGFPASVDGHVFRREDVLSMIGSDAIENPTNLETIMAKRVEGLFGERRPLMMSPYEQCVVGVPVNRVSDTSGVVNGERFPQTTHWLNKRFLQGQRLSLDLTDFSSITACHHEVQFGWEAA